MELVCCFGGYDRTGPHLFEVVPSGNYFEYEAQAMGARSQASKTYLEKHFEGFKNLTLDELIKHALTALKASSSKALTSKNTTIAYVGSDSKFTILDDDAVRPYVAQLEQNEDAPEPQSDGAGEGGNDDDDDADEDGGPKKKAKTSKDEAAKGKGKGSDSRFS